MKLFVLYVAKSGSGRRDTFVRAFSADHARILFERMCLEDGERLMCVYPYLMGEVS